MDRGRFETPAGHRDILLFPRSEALELLQKGSSNQKAHQKHALFLVPPNAPLVLSTGHEVVDEGLCLLSRGCHNNGQQKEVPTIQGAGLEPHTVGKVPELSLTGEVLAKGEKGVETTRLPKKSCTWCKEVFKTTATATSERGRGASHIVRASPSSKE